MNRFELLAIVLGLLPLALCQLVRSRADRRLWEMALDLPLALAVDLLVVLSLTLALPLALAVLVARGLWVGAAAALLGVRWARRRRAGSPRPLLSPWPRWPRELGARALAAATVTVVAVAWLSTWLSRACHNFDRGWHIPLVASLGGQRLPFVNVYQPEQRLEYHFMGDVFAALLQACSLGRIHSSLALSLAHDLLYSLLALTVALLLWDFGVRRISYVLFGALATILAGPLTLFADTASRSFTGYNFINFFKLSYRPHVPLAALLIVGFAGAVLVRAHYREPSPSPRRTVPVLGACVAVLTLTDESSAGLLGLALGAGWLAWPGLLAERRKWGIAILAALLGCVYLPHLAFGGVLGPGTSQHWLVTVPWRSPGYYQRPVPFTARNGFQLFAYDIAPFALAALGGLAVFVRRRTRADLAGWLFYATLLCLSALFLCRVEARSAGPEPLSRWSTQGHRFMTALMLAMPLYAAYWLGGRGVRTKRGLAARPGAVATSLLLGALVLSSISSAEWIRTRGKQKCIKPSSFGTREDLFKVDCREDVGARLGQAPTIAYGQRAVLYPYAGCRSSHLAAQMAKQYSLKVGGAAFDREALVELDANLLAPDQALTVICSVEPRIAGDRLCATLVPRGGCQPLGRKVQRCELSASERKALLRDWPATSSSTRSPRKPSKPDARSDAADVPRSDRDEDAGVHEGEPGVTDEE